MDGLRITPRITLAESELEERFIAAAGPGGQNVNKVATAVQLRFDALNSPALSPAIRARLAVLAGRRMTDAGVLVIAANRHRTQDRNRADARERLAELIRAAAVPPVFRVKTRPTLASKTRRLEAKSVRAGIKRGRGAADGRLNGPPPLTLAARRANAPDSAAPTPYTRRRMLTDLPNLLTLSRIAAIPLLVACVAARTPGGDLLATLLFIAAGVTDWLDGHLARTRRQQSDLGRMLDPIADKLLVGATLLVLAGQARFPDGGLYAAIVILMREILVSGLREYLGGIRISLPVTWLAKWKTGFQMGALGTLLAGDDVAALLHVPLPVSAIGEGMLWVAAVLTLVTGWGYLQAGLRHVQGAPSRP